MITGARKRLSNLPLKPLMFLLTLRVWRISTRFFLPFRQDFRKLGRRNAVRFKGR